MHDWFVRNRQLRIHFDEDHTRQVWIGLEDVATTARAAKLPLWGGKIPFNGVGAPNAGALTVKGGAVGQFTL